MPVTRARRNPSVPAFERGFTLIELMIAVGLSLMILAGLVTVFVNNSRTRQEIERTTRQIENGRYAIDLLSSNLTLAGFYSEFDPTDLATPALPLACATAATDIKSALALPVQGYREATALTAGLSCISDELLDGTDVLVVRRTGTCLAGEPGCGDPKISGSYYYFQASMCNPTKEGIATEAEKELASGSVDEWYRLEKDTTKLDRHKRTCTTTGCDCSTPGLADIRRYHTHIYFVAKNSVGSDGIRTLKRAELIGTGSGWTIVPLVEGIENLKLVYGIDASGDGMPESYTAAPATAADWRNVTSVKVYVLAKNTEPSPGYTNTKKYQLDSGTPEIAPSDAYRRHVFSTTVKLTNVAGRRGT